MLRTSLLWDRGDTGGLAGQPPPAAARVPKGRMGKWVLGDEAAWARLPKLPPLREASTWLSCKVHPLGLETCPASVCHPRGSHPAPYHIREDLSPLPWVPPQRGESLGRAGLGAGPC